MTETAVLTRKRSRFLNIFLNTVWTFC